MNNPIVSVIVPMYNEVQYIKKCVDSILEQTLRSFEIILVDDGSTDGCFELCRKLYGGNDKIHLLRHEKNLGSGAARNAGMKHAHGKYVYFVNAADFILPSALKKFYIAAEKSQADVVHAAGWFELYQDEVEPVRKENLRLKRDTYEQDGLLKNNLLYKLEEHWKKSATNSNMWLCFCRREFLEKMHFVFLNVAEQDALFTFALLCLTERYCILHALFYVKRNISDPHANAPRKFFDGMRAMLIGSTYLEKILDNVSRFKGYELWRENILAAFFYRVMEKYTAPHHRNFAADAQLNEIAEISLTPFFPNCRGFAKYFFNGFHVLHRQVKLLNRRNAETISHVKEMFMRIELSRNKIVFVNFNGQGFGCNPKYIAEEILRQNLPCDLVWLVNDPNAPMPEKIRKVHYAGLEAAYEQATAKIVVTNTKNALPFPDKKDGQFFIMTWHSGQDFKLVEGAAADKLPPAYVAESKKNSAMTDLMIAGTKEQFDDFRRVFYYDGKILTCGLPRNDIFFRNDAKLAAQIRKNLNVPRFSKIVMYAPTVRENFSADVYRFDAKKLLSVLEKRFGDEWTLLTRFHPRVAANDAVKNFFAASENIIDVTNYPDVQELILISDALISDYSSVIADFMFTGKRVFIFAKDFDAYTNERGFKPLYFELPYKINRNEAELFRCIETFNDAAVAPKVKHFIEKVHPFGTGHAAAEVVETIKSIMK